jgi:hypothetical protein
MFLFYVFLNFNYLSLSCIAYLHLIVHSVWKSVYIDIYGKFYMAVFMYPHLTHKIFSLYNVNLLNMPCLKNQTAILDDDFLY